MLQQPSDGRAGSMPFTFPLSPPCCLMVIRWLLQLQTLHPCSRQEEWERAKPAFSVSLMRKVNLFFPQKNLQQTSVRDALAEICHVDPSGFKGDREASSSSSLHCGGQVEEGFGNGYWMNLPMVYSSWSQLWLTLLVSAFLPLPLGSLPWSPTFLGLI